MIVKMKKTSLIVLDTSREESLKQLRKLGVMHIESQVIQNDELKQLEDKQQLLSRGLQSLPDEKESNDKAKQKKTKSLPKQGFAQIRKSFIRDFNLDKIDENFLKFESNALSPEETEKYWFELAQQILKVGDKKRTIQEEVEQLKREEQRLLPWGEFDPKLLQELQAKKLQLKLYYITLTELANLPADLIFFEITRDKTNARIVVINPPAGFNIPGEEFKLSEQGLQEIRLRVRTRREELVDLELALEHIGQYREILQAGVDEYSKRIEFDRTKLSMSIEGALSYLIGYVPVDNVTALQETAKKHSWALLVEDPGPDDPAPTLVHNKKPIRIIHPMFEFLGVTPGYREYDISFWFLLFFSVFFAMIVGDGAYGFVFLVLTIIARLAMRKAPAEPFLLLFVTSISTIIWGAITGTWFSSQYLAQIWPFSAFVINSIATFPLTDIDTNKNIMWICFVLGVTQLSLAHIINFFRGLPHIKAIADLGWVGIIWGMYFLVQIMVMKQDPDSALIAALPDITYTTAVIWLVAIGAGLVFIFGRQENNFFKGFLIGLAFSPLTSLSIVSAFADIISYVRLFAVGLASVEVAKAFNSMAAGVGFEGPMAIGAVLILFLGHLLNITMSSLSIIVHGVRLNMLEFSGHLGLEWTGVQYRPFKEKS